MSKQAKKGLVPELRFPEFRDSENWVERPVGDICEVLNNQRKPVTSTARVAGEYPYYGASGIVDYIDDFIFNERLVLVGEDGAKWGAFEPTAFIAEGKYWVNNHAHVLRPVEVSDTLLASYLTMLDLQKYVTGAAPPKLTLGKLKEIPIICPTNPDEQKKIAACLSSLDALLTAEREKLEALREHKKGLMQQLFPVEGAKVPALRFPGFEGEWEEKPLGSYTTIVRGGSPRPIDDFTTTDEDGLNWLKIGDVDKEAKYVTRTEQRVIHAALSKTRVVAPGDLIMSNSMSFGRPYIMQMHSCIHDGWIAVTEINRKVDTEFLYYLISSDRSQTYFSSAAAGGGVKNLNADIIKVLPTLKPKDIKEQQALASCLSALDVQVTLQAERILILEDHKNGLMQGLFPPVN